MYKIIISWEEYEVLDSLDWIIIFGFDPQSGECSLTENIF